MYIPRRQIFFVKILVYTFLLVTGLFIQQQGLFAQQPVSALLSSPIFSHNSGYVPVDFALEISHPDGAEIRYTLDGSEPNQDSFLYTGAVEFDQRPDQRLRFIRTTPFEADARGFGWRQPDAVNPIAMVVRAKAFMAGAEPSETVTATFFDESIMHHMPLISISANHEHLFSDATGIYVPGDVYNQNGWNQNDHWGRPNANYHQRGVEWERPAHFELIETDGTVYKQNIGVRIHGGGSRVLPQKAFRLYARSDYGESRFRYDMFRDGETGYNRLILRNSGQDFFHKTTMFMDAISQSLVSSLSFDTQKFRAFAVYVNGEYWGIKNLRERYDHHYLDRNHGVKEDEIDYLANMPRAGGVGEVKNGSADHFNAILDSLENKNINDLGGMAFIERHVDVRNFAEIHAANVYFANIDWPGNNNDYWRYTGSPEGRGSSKDGRFRWMMFDMDFGFSHLGSTGYSADLFHHYLTTQDILWSNHPRSTRMFRSFMQNREFRDYFINVQLDLLNTLFKEERVKETIGQFKEMYRHEIRNHLRRWGYPSTYTEWERNIDERVEFAGLRPRNVRSQISGRFNTGFPTVVTIDVNHREMGVVQVNTIRLAGGTPGIDSEVYPWEGLYMSDIPVELTARPNSGYRFSHWDINGEKFYQQYIHVKPKPGIQIKANFSEMPERAGEGKELLYFWHFDTELPNDTPLKTIFSSYSSTGYNGVINFKPAVTPYPPLAEDETNGIMDRVNDPTELNYQPAGNGGLEYDDGEMRGIRVRNPSRTQTGDSALIFDIPTEEFQDIVVAFAARRTPSGQEQMVFYYSLSSGEPEWTRENLSTGQVTTSDSYELVIIDFSNVNGHAHNPHFRVKISFDGDQITGSSGNTRFNNIAVFGLPYTGPRIEDIMESSLKPNFPNPFTEFTTIPYQVLVQSRVKIDVFSLEGRHIITLKESDHEPGFYAVPFSGRGFASGVYLVRLQAGDRTDHQKMLLVK
ncbi:MAG: T9SS C-terminal target domain-containing protein [Balneolaceae bacterium]|nr:MAG: T9SS C-terminal target domain-containing protein [Balneolaceae bacterium]